MRNKYITLPRSNICFYMVGCCYILNGLQFLMAKSNLIIFDMTPYTYLRAGFLFETVPSGWCSCMNWWRSPNFMYSTTTHSGSSWVQTPNTRTMFGSFNRAMILTSFWKSALKKNTHSTNMWLSLKLNIAGSKLFLATCPQKEVTWH